MKHFRTRGLRLTAAMLAMIALLAFAALPSFAEGHTETTPYNWFFCKTDDHTPPPLGSGLEFTEKYPLYYIDRRAEEDDKVIYLTFDVGYENGNVCKILDALQAHRATGAFFILSHVALHEKELVQRMLDEGHTVCNHTARHPDMSAIRDEALFREQLETLEKQFLEIYLRHHGQACGRVLYEKRRGPVGGMLRESDRRGRRLKRRCVPDSLRLRPFHRRCGSSRGLT